MQLNATAVMMIVGFGCASTGCMLGNLLLYMMIGEINRRRPEKEQIGYFGFTPVKMGLIFREYRRHYPRGKVRMYTLLCIVVMFGGGGIFLLGLFWGP